MISTFPAAQVMISIPAGLIHTRGSQSKPSDCLEQRLQIKEPGAFASIYSWIWVVGFGVFLPKSCFSYLPSIFFASEGINCLYGTEATQASTHYLSVATAVHKALGH